MEQKDGETRFATHTKIAWPNTNRFNICPPVELKQQIFPESLCWLPNDWHVELKKLASSGLPSASRLIEGAHKVTDLWHDRALQKKTTHFDRARRAEQGLH